MGYFFWMMGVAVLLGGGGDVCAQTAPCPKSLTLKELKTLDEKGEVMIGGISYVPFLTPDKEQIKRALSVGGFFKRVVASYKLHVYDASSKACIYTYGTVLGKHRDSVIINGKKIDLGKATFSLVIRGTVN